MGVKHPNPSAMKSDLISEVVSLEADIQSVLLVEESRVSGENH
jgi:hypothetical protein